VLVEIDQSGRPPSASGVLYDAAIAHLGITEDTLQNAKGHSTLARTLDLVRFLRFSSSSTPCLVFTRRLSCPAPWAGLVYRLGLPLIARVAHTFFSSPCSKSAAYVVVHRGARCRPSAPRLPCYRLRYAPWHRSNTGCPSWSDALRIAFFLLFLVDEEPR